MPPIASVYYYTLQFSPILPLAYYLIRRPPVDRATKYFLAYFVISLLLSVIMTVMILYHGHTLSVMNIGVLLYTLCIVPGFLAWDPGRTARAIIVGLSVLFVIVWICEMTFMGNFTNYTKYARPAQGILFLVTALATVYEANRDTAIPIVEQPRFWMSAGVMLYYGGMLFLNVLSNPLLQISQETLKNALLIQPGLNLFSFLLYTMSLRCHFLPKISSV